MAIFLLIQESLDDEITCLECGEIDKPDENPMTINGKTLIYLNCSSCEEFLGFKMTKQELFKELGHSLWDNPK